jgi:hypothetical protein
MVRRRMVDVVMREKANGGFEVRRFMNMFWLEGRSQILLYYLVLHEYM